MAKMLKKVEKSKIDNMVKKLKAWAKGVWFALLGKPIFYSQWEDDQPTGTSSGD